MSQQVPAEQSTRLIDRIARLIAQDVGRGASSLQAAVGNQLAGAAQSLLTSRPGAAMIITGFYIPRAAPPAPETDGPVGAVQLGLLLAYLGYDVHLVTDEPCAKAVKSAADIGSLDARLWSCPTPALATADEIEHWLGLAINHFSAETRTTHTIAIERLGPNHSGQYLNMNATDVGMHTAPLDRLFSGGPWISIGIGDGGNEIGMGSIPCDAVSRAVNHGDTIHCRTPSDYCIVGGVSNWAAAGLVAAIAILNAGIMPLAKRILKPAWSQHMLDQLSQRRLAVDGVSAKVTATVDGLSQETYHQIIDTLSRCLPES